MTLSTAVPTSLMRFYTTYDDAAIWNYTSGITVSRKLLVHLQHDVFTSLDNYARGILDINQNDILFSSL